MYPIALAASSSVAHFFPTAILHDFFCSQNSAIINVYSRTFKL